MADLTLKFGVQGDSTLKSAVSAVNSQIKSLDAEMKLAVSEMANMDNAEDKAAKKNEILGKQYDANRQKLDLLNKQHEASKKTLEDLGKQLEEAKARTGDNSAEVAKLQNAYNKQAKATADLGTELIKTKTKMQDAKNGMDGLESETKQAKQAMDDAKGSVVSFGDMLKAKLTGEAIIGGVKKLAGGLKDLALGSAFAADDIATLSVVTGISTDALQEYQYMAQLVDVDVSTVTGSLKKLTTNMNSAAKGSSSAQAAFQKLGVQWANSDGTLRNSQDVFADILEALGTIENETERDAMAMDLFGKSAQDLNPMILAGKDTLTEYAKQAHDTGYVMDEEMLNKNLAVSDSYEMMQNSITALKNTIGTEFAPVLQEAIEGLTSLLQWITDNKDMIIEYAVPAVAALTAGFIAYKGAMLAMSIIDTVKKATEGMTLAQAALNAVMKANPIAIVVTVIAGLVTALVTAYHTSDTFRAKVDAAFTKVKDAIIRAIDWIKEAVQWLKDLPGNALKWGKDMIDNFVQGIKNKINAVGDAVKSVANKVKSFLGFSEPDEGPLSNFHTYGPDMMELYAEGINKNVGLVARASRNAAAAVRNGLSNAAGTVNATGALAGATGGAGVTQVLRLVVDGKTLAEIVNQNNQWIQRANNL